METKPASWQDRFALTLCPALEINSAIPSAAIGVAVVYASTGTGETIFLVLESRARSLRELCLKRLQTAKLPPAAELQIAFKGETPTYTSPVATDAACRAQVLLGAELRRALRPAMR